MKKLSVFICVQLWLIVSCFSISAQDFRKIRKGIEHAKITKQMKSADGKDENVVINLLRLNLKKVRLDVVHAFDRAIGLEKTSSIAARHGAIAAINAGFFRLDKSIFAGDAAGILMIDGKLLSESINNRIAVGIVNEKRKTAVNFGLIQSASRAGFGVDSEIAFSGVNRERKANEIILFTPDFHKTTLTDSTGTEVILSECSVVNFAGRCNKAEVVEGKGSSTIPTDGFVISIGKEASEKSNSIVTIAKEQLSNPNQFNSTFRFVYEIVALEKEKQTFFSNVEDITNGVPQLIKNGKIEITWQEEKSSKSFVETHHPRTAVAKLKNGKFLMVTVDGRSKESGGISLPDLGAFLLELGATDAMNLDGGGSTTMFLDGKVVNKPSDATGERAVGDAILVFPRK